MVSFKQCSLLGATFAAATLYGLDFSRSDLRHASFREALLIGCQLEETSLFQADFSGARLAALDLVGGRKLPTSFRRSTVTHARFQGATLRDAIGKPACRERAGP